MQNPAVEHREPRGTLLPVTLTLGRVVPQQRDSALSRPREYYWGEEERNNVRTKMQSRKERQEVKKRKRRRGMQSRDKTQPTGDIVGQNLPKTFFRFVWSTQCGNSVSVLWNNTAECLGC